MTKVIMKEEKNGIEFGDLKIGDCFLDGENLFCIKVNPTTCLVANDDLESWEEYDDCKSFEEVYPVDVEIHIIN
jgi:hypothetical protein